MRKLSVWRIDKFAKKVGEAALSSTLSSFAVPLNSEVEEFIRNNIPAEDLLGMIHYNLEIMDADRQGKSPYDFSPAAIEEIRKIKAILDRDET